MTITVGVTDNAWADFLWTQPHITEANFWLPSGGSFKSLQQGELFLFKTKSPRTKLVGGGRFEEFFELRVSEAWACFGTGNGVGSEEELHDAIQTYRSRTDRLYEPDPTIGCVILHDLFFAEFGEALPQPQHWAHNIVTWKNYKPGDVDWEYVVHASRVLGARPRIDPIWEPGLRSIAVEVDPDLPRFGEETTVRARLGQGGFRARVSTAYDWRCAITGSVLTPALQAAHIKPYASGGSHEVTNGILLRSDVHTLFDQGYLSITPDHRLRVSPRLRTDSGNGAAYYAQEARGEPIRTPQTDAELPNPEHLAWHLATIFRAA